jgi:diaminopimelate epimerase
MHANGDDFIVVDGRGLNNPIDAALVQRLGDRNRGIGFNQLVVIGESEDAFARLTFWNANGTQLDVCGSATRGVAHLLMASSDKSAIVLQTNRGLSRCLRNASGTVSVDMGSPLLEWDAVPLSKQVDTNHLPLDGDPHACSMGNPHCTFFVSDLSRVDVGIQGPAIENDLLFPHGTNVHFVQVLSRSQIRLRIWERGGGIPLGSGSCCCGAVVAGIRRGLLDETVEVQCDGGSAVVRWSGTGAVFLEGPRACFINRFGLKPVTSA